MRKIFLSIVFCLLSVCNLNALGFEQVQLSMSENAIFKEFCDSYGFEILSETDKNVTGKYDYNFETRYFDFPKIFESQNVKVYFGGDRDIFINNGGKWTNYGHQCTKMYYYSVVQKCGYKGKIKIVWYEEKTIPGIFGDLAAGVDPWGLSEVILVYKSDCYDEHNCEQFDKIPLVFLRKYQDIIFTNYDMSIKYWDEDGIVQWQIDNKLCESVPEVLKDESESWEKLGFMLRYVGRYHDEIGVADIYSTVALDGAKAGFPTVYKVYNNGIVSETTGVDALDILNTIKSNI